MPAAKVRLKKLELYRWLAPRNQSRRAFCAEYGLNEHSIAEAATVGHTIGDMLRQQLMDATGLPFEALFEIEEIEETP